MSTDRGTWYEVSSPPQVLISTTTGSVEAFCWAAATAATCPGLTQVLACAKSTTKNIGPNASKKAIRTLAFLVNLNLDILYFLALALVVELPSWSTPLSVIAGAKAALISALVSLPSSRKATDKRSITLATARIPPIAIASQRSTPITAPAPMTPRADAIKVATIRAKTLRVVFNWRLLNGRLSPECYYNFNRYLKLVVAYEGFMC